MSHSAEQMRKKAELRAEALRHQQYASVDEMKDSQVYPRNPDSLKFAENDGDADDLRLASKEKKPQDNSRMPSIQDTDEAKRSYES